MIKYNRVYAGCMDCDLRTGHFTLSEAQGSILSHVFQFPTHRPLVSDEKNGWHRAWMLEEI